MSKQTETFGDYLKTLRGKIPQGKLAEAIGKTTMYISNIEKGKNNPPDELQLKKIANVLKLNEQERLDLIDKAAAARNTVAQDIFNQLYKYKELRQFVRQMSPDIVKYLKILLNNDGNWLKIQQFFESSLFTSTEFGELE